MGIKNKVNNKIGFVFLATLLLIAGCSHNEKVNESEPETIHKKLNEKHQFKVQGCVINYNGTDLYMSSGVAPWLKALGKNYRVVDSSDGINLTNLYIYDDIGVRLVERKSDKKIDSFRFRLERPPHDVRIETDKEIEEELKKPDTEQVRQIFKDAIDVEVILIGAYPMQEEIREKFSASTGVSYSYSADCLPTQIKNGGEDFSMELSTSFEDPEVIDHMYFYNYFDSMSDEEKERYRKDFCDGPDRDHPIIGGWCDDYYPAKK